MQWVKHCPNSWTICTDSEWLSVLVKRASKKETPISQLLASYDKLDYQILESFLKNETQISNSFGLMKKLNSAFPIISYNIDEYPFLSDVNNQISEQLKDLSENSRLHWHIRNGTIIWRYCSLLQIFESERNNIPFFVTLIFIFTVQANILCKIRQDL